MANGERSLFGLGFLGKDKEPSPEQDLYDQAFQTYKAWHVREGKNRNVIDFDLTPRWYEESLTNFLRSISRFTADSPTRYERSIIVNDLADLLKKTESMPSFSPQSSHNLEFCHDQIEASLYYARKRRGDSVDNNLYIEKTTGTKLELTPEKILLDRREIVLGLASRLGIQEPTEQALLGFNQDHELEPDEAQKMLREQCDLAKSRVEKFLGEGINFKYSIVAKNVDDYWRVWAYTDPETQLFILSQNFFRTPYRIWTPGKIEELAPHEMGEHLIRMAKRKALVERKQLHPFFGLTTIHGPEPFIDEGLAQTLVFFLPGAYEALSVEGKFQVQTTLLRSMVYSNVHVMVNQPEGSDTQEVIDYVRKFIPWEPEEWIENEIKRRSQNPLYQVYLYTYGIGARRHLQYSEILSERGKKVFLQSIYARPYTPRQEERLVANIITDPQNTVRHPAVA